MTKKKNFFGSNFEKAKKEIVLILSISAFLIFLVVGFLYVNKKFSQAGEKINKDLSEMRVEIDNKIEKIENNFNKKVRGLDDEIRKNSNLLDSVGASLESFDERIMSAEKKSDRVVSLERKVKVLEEASLKQRDIIEELARKVYTMQVEQHEEIQGDSASKKNKDSFSSVIIAPGVSPIITRDKKPEKEEEADEVDEESEERFKEEQNKSSGIFKKQ
jgi:uncharacterized protein YoxC